MDDKIAGIVDEYTSYVTNNIARHTDEEKYKFDALRHFQDTFDIDTDDIANNLKRALSKVDNLAVGAGYYPVASIVDIASNRPEEAREALKILFSNDIPDIERFAKFQEIMIPLSQQYSHKNTSHPYNMDLRFMSLLLSLRMPDKFMYFKPTQVDTIYTKIYGAKTGTRGNDANRVLKARDLGVKILAELETRPEFQEISDAMGYGSEHNLWFAQDVIWHDATADNDDGGDAGTLLQKVKQYIAKNPDWRSNVNWPLTDDQIAVAVADFQTKFSPDKLKQMSNEEILRWIPYRQVTTKDGLSYLLEHSPVIAKMGGIGGGSAGKMGYYQGKDGQWKNLSNAVTTQEDVLEHRKVDIEVLSTMYDFIAKDDYTGLRQYINSLASNAKDAIDNNVPTTESIDRYKAVLPGLVWVRKYFAIMFPDKFVQLYGNNFIEKLEAIANMGKINGSGKVWDYSLWYRQMHKISAIGPKLNLTNYELSSTIWQLINAEEGEDHDMEDLAAENTGSTTNLNTIIYGPPGTGKTWNALNVYAKQLLSDQAGKGRSKNEVLADQLKDLTWWQVTALALYHAQNPIKVSELAETDIVKSYSEFVKNRTTSIKPTLWATLQERSDPESSNSSYRIEGIEFFSKNNDSEWSLTDEGRKYVEETLAADIKLDVQAEEQSDWKKYLRSITFHQSYSYEEFIEGIRPVLDSGVGTALTYEIRDGIFKELCVVAANDPGNKYLIIIDEINRGNIAKIFGELITLLEEDKRENMYVRLPYSHDSFTVPKNLYVLGTMNTADRSIALLDIALRRRFDFVELMPQYQLISNDILGTGLDLAKLLEQLNQKISIMIDRDHQIGHSYFMGINTLEDLSRAWYKKVLPLVQEYFYNDWERLEIILGKYGGEGTGFVTSRVVDFPGDSDLNDTTLYDIFQYPVTELVAALKGLIVNEKTTDTDSLRV